MQISGLQELGNDKVENDEDPSREEDATRNRWVDSYSDDADGRFQRDVNGHSGHVDKAGAQRRWDYNHARHLRD